MDKEANDAERADETASSEMAETVLPTVTEDLQERIARLEELLASKDGELVAVQETLAGTVAKYRAAVVATASGVPEELLKGETVEEIDASLEQARHIVSKVRSQLENDIAARGVPAGAPQRTPVDMSFLSPAAKIVHALTQERS